MKRLGLTIMAFSLAIGIVELNAGSGKSAGIGIGAGVGGFLLGRATAPRQDRVYRETVYVQQQPTYTTTTTSPGLGALQAELAAERSKRISLETEVAQLRAKITELQRENNRLERRNRQAKRKLKKETTTAAKS